MAAGRPLHPGLVTLFELGQQPALWRRKVLACHLALANSDEPITDSAALYDAQGELHPDLDVRLLNFITAALLLAANSVATLGKWLQGKHTPTPEEWRAIRRNDRCQRIGGED